MCSRLVARWQFVHAAHRRVFVSKRNSKTMLNNFLVVDDVFIVVVLLPGFKLTTVTVMLE